MMTKENLPVIAKRLRQLRSGKNVSQERAAEEMGISQGALSAMENGLRPSAEQAHRLSQYYELPLENFWQPPVIPANRAANN